MADKRLRYLTDDEIKLLQRLLDASKLLDPSLKSAQDGLWSHGEDQSAPEVYVARPINGVIPAMTPASSTGTGTECDIYDSPGYAECNIYEIIDTEECGPALMPVEDHEEIVYNLSETEISTGGDYIPVMRDKFGRWLAVYDKSTSAQYIEFAACEDFSYGDTIEKATVVDWQPDGSDDPDPDNEGVDITNWIFYGKEDSQGIAAVLRDGSFLSVNMDCQEEVET